MWRDFGTDEPLHPNVLQADGVQHPGGGLHDPLWRVPRRGEQRQPLHDHGPQPGDVVEGDELQPVPVGARRAQDGVLQDHAPHAGGEVGRPGGVHHTTSLASNTGPSLQTRRYAVFSPSRTAVTHPQHTPKPHAMWFSRDAWTGTSRGRASSAISFSISRGPQARMVSRAVSGAFRRAIRSRTTSVTRPKNPAVPSSVHRWARPGAPPPGTHSLGGSWSRERAPRNTSNSARCASRTTAAGKTVENPTPPPTSHQVRSSRPSSKPFPSGRVIWRGSPSCRPESSAVPRPTTL